MPRPFPPEVACRSAIITIPDEHGSVAEKPRIAARLGAIAPGHSQRTRPQPNRTPEEQAETKQSTDGSSGTSRSAQQQ